ncbi:MAG: Ig-like domain-containing protein [Gammaproteobacteria bacterium]|nr:Ig-like domain-containing protein [Gammaproteobacteria bacterium]
MSDGALLSEVVSKVTVNPVNDRPIVEYDRAEGYDNGVHNTATGLLANDVDVDGDALHIGGITGASANVHVTGVGGGSISWQASSAGAGWITYTVSDGNGGVTESRPDLAIAHRAIPPEFVSVTMSPTEGTYRNVTVHVQNGGRLTVTARGTARATDPDGPDDMIEYSGTGIAVEPGSGNWTYTTQLRLSAAEAGPGNWVTRSVEVPVTIHATDVEGNSVTRSQTFTYSARIQMNIASKPVVLDLDGDGVHLVGIGDSAAGFDFDGDGVADASGWIAGDGDALLAFDHDGDRRVTRADEIAFVGYVEGAETDLEGLAAFDSDGDGRLTANDEAWAAFGLWVDDGDGVADAGEFEDLDGAGITGIDLVSDGREVLVEGNVIHGEALFTRADGSAGVAADVGFASVRGGEVEAELVGLDADAGDDGGRRRRRRCRRHDTRRGRGRGDDRSARSRWRTRRGHRRERRWGRCRLRYPCR